MSPENNNFKYTDWEKIKNSVNNLSSQMGIVSGQVTSVMSNFSDFKGAIPTTYNYLLEERVEPSISDLVTGVSDLQDSLDGLQEDLTEMKEGSSYRNQIGLIIIGIIIDRIFTFLFF